MSSAPHAVRYALAAIIGAFAVPAAAVTFVFGAIMALGLIVASIMALTGKRLFPSGSEQLLAIEVLVIVLAAVLFVFAVEATRLLAPGTPRRRMYKRAVITALSAVGMVLPVWSFASYVMLHSRMEPNLPLPLIVITVVLHVGAGLVAWPIWLLRPEITSPSSSREFAS